MPSVVDAATMLIPSGLISSSQDFTPLLLRPRTLATCQRLSGNKTFIREDLMLHAW
jgi:hypothetical protein